MQTIWWVAVGLGAGWATSGLMPYGRERRVPGAVVGAVVGVIGAFLGGAAARLLAPGAAGEGVTQVVAAMAGAVGLAFAVSAFASGRRARDAAGARAARDADRGAGAGALTVREARDVLVEQLLVDAAAHDAERYDEVGRGFDAVERRFPRGSAPELARLRVALTFWDAWIDARNVGWRSAGGVRQGEWPVLARGVASDLVEYQDISNSTLRGRFHAAGRSRGARSAGGLW